MLLRNLTLKPDSLSDRANCVLTVDLPTPPFPDRIKITCFTESSIFVRTFTALKMSNSTRKNQPYFFDMFDIDNCRLSVAYVS